MTLNNFYFLKMLYCVHPTFFELFMIYFLNINNYYRKVCISTNVGDICGLEESIDTFKRVQIMRIRNDKNISEDKVKFVDVRCIDSGIIHEHVNVRSLFYKAYIESHIKYSTE